MRVIKIVNECDDSTSSDDTGDTASSEGSNSLQDFLNIDLFYAIRMRETKQEIMGLLTRGAQVNATNQYNQSALIVAIHHCEKEIIELLLDNGANVDVETSEGKRALWYACERGDEAIVRLLIQRGACVSDRDFFGSSVLHAAAIGGSIRIVELLLNTIKDVDVFCCNDGWTALHYSVKGKHEGLSNFLLDRGANVDAGTIQGETPLYLATAAGSENIVKLLLNKGASINVANELGQTILHAAVEGNNENIVKIFLELGLSVNAKDNSGVNPLLTAAGRAKESIIQLLLDHGAIPCEVENNKSTLHHTSERGFIHIVRQLLKLGVDIYAKDQNQGTILHSAVKSGNIDIVELFLNLGLSAQDKDSNEKSCLHFAAAVGNGEVIQLLLNEGLDINNKDGSGQTALYCAIESKKENSVKILLQRGISIDERDDSTKTALHFAISTEGNLKGIVRLLLEYGAGVNIQSTSVLKKDKFLDARSTTIFSMECAALACCIVRENQELIRLLLDYGADLVGVDEIHNSALHYALNNWKVYSPESDARLNFDHKDGNRSTKILEQLLDHGIDVNTRNNEGLSSLNLYIFGEEASNTKVELLLIYGANFDAKDTQNYTYFDPLYMFGRVIKRHMVIRLSKSMSISEETLHFVENLHLPYDKESYQSVCEKEMQAMRINVIGDSAVTYYNLLVSRDLSQLAAYARNASILEIFKSSTIKEMYPEYAFTLSYQLKRGKWRNLLESKIQSFFLSVANAKGNKGLPKLPWYCASKIISYLQNGDIRRLIRVCNIEFNSEISDIEPAFL